MAMHLISDVPGSLFCASLECAFPNTPAVAWHSRGEENDGLGPSVNQKLLLKEVTVDDGLGPSVNRKLLLKEITVDIHVLKRLSWEVVPECYLP